MRKQGNQLTRFLYRLFLFTVTMIIGKSHIQQSGEYELRVKDISYQAVFMW